MIGGSGRPECYPQLDPSLEAEAPPKPPPQLEPELEAKDQPDPEEREPRSKWSKRS